MNFATLETELVTFVQALPLAARLRVVDPLPEADIETLVKRFGRDAPAVYASAGNFVREGEDTIRYTAALMLVSRNASGYAGPRQDDARHGEGKGEAGLIGLYEILAHLMPQLHLAQFGGTTWHVQAGGELLEFPAAWRQGLYATTLQLQTGLISIEPTLDPSDLDDFALFAADWDLGPEPDDQLEAEDDITLPIQETP